MFGAPETSVLNVSNKGIYGWDTSRRIVYASFEDCLGIISNLASWRGRKVKSERRSQEKVVWRFRGERSELTGGETLGTDAAQVRQKLCKIICPYIIMTVLKKMAGRLSFTGKQ